MILLISGRAGEGKTTLANIIVDLKPSQSSIFPFAQSLKETAKFMGWDGNKDSKGRQLLQDLGRIGREYNIDIWVSNAYNKIVEGIDEFFLNRSLYIIDDWRFENEYNFLTQVYSPIVTVRIQRDPQHHLLLDSPLYNDISEVSLPKVDVDSDPKRRYGVCKDSYYDYFMPNYKGLDSLKLNTKFLLEKLEEEYNV